MVDNTLADWSKALLGGFVGAAVVFCLQIWLEWQASKKRTKGHFAALKAEIEECGRIAAVYLEDKSPKAPLYRLPIICLPTTFSGLLEAKVLNGDQSEGLGDDGATAEAALQDAADVPEDAADVADIDETVDALEGGDVADTAATVDASEDDEAEDEDAE